MIPLTLAELARLTHGEVHGDPALVVSGPAYLDSRAPEPAGLFVAVRGERSDGHDHAAGAHAVLGSRPTAAPTVVVADPVVALARLARHLVDSVAPTVLAITGSHGKTGTKDLLAAALPGAVATWGNLNNELGVPLTALRLRPRDEQLVLEMGARGVGQLSWLCEVAPPDVAAVLCVGSAHLGEFGSPELVAHAKGELVEALRPGGTAVLNVDDPRVAAMASRTVARVLSVGRAGEVTWRRLAADRLGRPSFELGYAGDWALVTLRRVGAHHVINAAVAAGMALAVGEPLDGLAARLSAAPATPRRMQPRVAPDGLLVLDDSYNANPDAARAALVALTDIGRHRSGRTIAVLGEMRELGAGTTGAHRELGAFARECGVDVVLALGPAAEATAQAARGLAPATYDDALAWLRSQARPEDVVLVKGSRASGLDRLVDALLEDADPSLAMSDMLRPWCSSSEQGPVRCAASGSSRSPGSGRGRTPA